MFAHEILMICCRESRSRECPPSTVGVRVAVRSAQTTPTLTAHSPIPSWRGGMRPGDKNPTSIPSGKGGDFHRGSGSSPGKATLRTTQSAGLWQSHTPTAALTPSQHHPSDAIRKIEATPWSPHPLANRRRRSEERIISTLRHYTITSPPGGGETGVPVLEEDIARSDIE
ncbi:hypothetical protein Taro_019171 [Colocasia esculenta]|uniref:Uncharacterized protein n=1 Tax=Colocasia esculenta TaxID=4460 RepID=A0A843V4R7_COLES|nr:hypothetical protein [Colocasia esculenta]